MKTRKLMLLAAFVLCAMPACQKEEAPLSKDESGKHTVTIHASVSGTTKTILSKEGDNYKGLWEVGDVIYIYERVVGVSPDGTDTLEGSSTNFVESSPLASGGATATFTATFDSYWWESFSEYDDYIFTYSYVASTTNPWYMHTNYQTGEECLPLLLDSNQEIFRNGYNTANDMLISKWVSFNSRPTDISFSFARLGTIVEITLSGFESGDIIKSGKWYTGDTFMSTVDLEDILSYNPVTGTYSKYSGEILSSGSQFNLITFTCSDSKDAIVADASGQAVIYLRCLPGELDDWFGFICTVDRGGEEHVYSKMVPLSTLGRSLVFKDAGLTKFSVSLLPASAETMPDNIQYTTSESANRDGFTAVWECGANLSGYECYYGPAYDTSIKTALTVSDYGGGMVGASVSSGLEPGYYNLYVKGIPADGYGPTSFDTYEKTMTIGQTVSIEFAGNATLVDEASGMYLVKNRSNWYAEYAEESAYIIASNTNFGTYYGSSLTAVDRNLAWWFRTSYSQMFPGGLESIEFTLGKWYDASTYIEADVYGITAGNDEILLNGTAAETKNDKKYKYDLTGYAGVKVSCASSATLNSVYLNYYK